jgi:phytoene synthase
MTAFHRSHRSSSFAWGIRMLLPGQREAVRAIYAFCRAADDAADADPTGAAERVARWREEVALCYSGAPRHEVMRRLFPYVRTLKLERMHFDKILDGLEMDLARRRYRTLEELLGYCDCVAGAVGLLCLRVMGLDGDARAVDYSRKLSYGLQLTNIVRDLGRDVALDRVYLPQEDFAAFEYTEAQLKRREATEGFFRLARFEALRAQKYLEDAPEGLTRDLRRRLLGPEIMRETYRQLLKKIMTALDWCLDGSPPALSWLDKAMIAGFTWLQLRR